MASLVFQRLQWLLPVFIWFVGTITLCYLPRQNEFNQIALWGLVSFAGYFYLIGKNTGIPIKTILLLALVVRLMIIADFPHLSDDIYRFIWDGRLLHLGLNPYRYIPADIVGNHALLGQSLYESLNSPHYYSIYPPIAQVIFWVSTLIHSPQFLYEAMVMRAIHFAFELGTLRYLWMLLKAYDVPQSRIAIYALNPLVILEVSANLHHEGIVLFFLLATLYHLKQGRVFRSGVFMALSIATKILPILFVPVIFFRLQGKQRWTFVLSTTTVAGLLFLPVFSSVEILQHIGSSAQLYVSSFEFNASIYYLFRGLGQAIYGYNIIGVLGPILKIITVLSILFIAVKYGRRSAYSLPLLILVSYSIFLFLSSTVHPWYIILLIGMAPLTQLRFPIVWSALILATYINYSFQPYHESLWVVGIEYLLIGVFIIFEINQSKKIKKWMQNPMVHIH